MEIDFGFASLLHNKVNLALQRQPQGTATKLVFEARMFVHTTNRDERPGPKQTNPTKLLTENGTDNSLRPLNVEIIVSQRMALTQKPSVS